MLFSIFLFLALNMHSHSGLYNYHSEICADKAGYYIYSPTAFIYHFDASLIPDSIVEKTGNGFQIDKINNKILTKYTYGVALLQAPFFLAAHILAKPMGYEPTGFSGIYQKMVNVASVFYFIIGLFFLFKVLKKYYSINVSILSLSFIAIGTNLFYYTINESGMSHIYSFSLFSILLFLIPSFDPLKTNRIISGIIGGALISLIILIRPTNILFIGAAFFFSPDKKNHLTYFFNFRFYSPDALLELSSRHISVLQLWR